MTIDLTFSSRLAASADEVWAAVHTLEGVNEELSPWVRMTAPAGAQQMPLEQAPLGRPAFTSTLLALGVVPFDRHELTLVEAGQRHFLERSRSLLQRRWEHERWVSEVPGGAMVRDRLHIEPRLAPDALVRPVIEAIFRNRHARLRRRFGEL